MSSIASPSSIAKRERCVRAIASRELRARFVAPEKHFSVTSGKHFPIASEEHRPHAAENHAR